MSSLLPKLLVLGAAAFIYVTAETLPVGLLPEISGDLGVGESAVGLLLTFYAYGVAVMTMPLIRFVRDWPRRRVVVITVAALAFSQLLSAVSVGYPMLVLSRMLCAATHGVFWAVVAPVAASLALPGKQGKAIATVYAGTSLALVAGNPITAAMGQWFGWRTAATILGVVAAAIAVALYFVLPALPVTRAAAGNKKSPRVLDGTLAILCGVTFLAVLGHFAAYTYFSLIVDRAIGSAGTTLTLMLMLYGLFGVVGIWVIGRTYDRWPRPPPSQLWVPSRPRRRSCGAPSAQHRAAWPSLLSGRSRCGVWPSPRCRSASSPPWCGPPLPTPTRRRRSTSSPFNWPLPPGPWWEASSSTPGASGR